MHDDVLIPDALYDAILDAVLKAKPDDATGEINRNSIIYALNDHAGILPERARFQDASH